MIKIKINKILSMFKKCLIKRFKIWNKKYYNLLIMSLDKLSLKMRIKKIIMLMTGNLWLKKSLTTFHRVLAAMRSLISMRIKRLCQRRPCGLELMQVCGQNQWFCCKTLKNVTIHMKIHIFDEKTWKNIKTCFFNFCSWHCRESASTRNWFRKIWREAICEAIFCFSISQRPSRLREIS